MNKGSDNTKASPVTSTSPQIRSSGVGTKDDQEDEKDENEVVVVGRIVTPNLKVYTLSELKSATRNFRPDTMVGEGGFGRVFKGWVDEKTLAPSKVALGIPVAVKKSNSDSDQGLKEWQVPTYLNSFRSLPTYY